VCSVEEKNAPAMRLYDRLGYRREPERDWLPEPGVALLVLGRELSGPR
jgi:ribosomal protein S18 acetylase RimI-like enzyme